MICGLYKLSQVNTWPWVWQCTCACLQMAGIQPGRLQFACSHVAHGDDAGKWFRQPSKCKQLWISGSAAACHKVPLQIDCSYRNRVAKLNKQSPEGGRGALTQLCSRCQIAAAVAQPPPQQPRGAGACSAHASPLHDLPKKGLQLQMPAVCSMLLCKLSLIAAVCHIPLADLHLIYELIACSRAAAVIGARPGPRNRRKVPVMIMRDWALRANG
jgi:hypothetical protein